MITQESEKEYEFGNKKFSPVKEEKQYLFSNLTGLF